MYTFAEESDSKVASGNKEWQIVYPKWFLKHSRAKSDQVSWLSSVQALTIVWVASAMIHTQNNLVRTFEPISINSNANIEFISQAKVTRMSKFAFSFGIYFGFSFFPNFSSRVQPRDDQFQFNLASYFRVPPLSLWWSLHADFNRLFVCYIFLKFQCIVTE